MIQCFSYMSELSSNPTIGIIGYGIVGHALSNGFSNASISYFDPKFADSDPIEEVVKKSEFIGLPTPMKSDESGIDLKIIEDVVAKITPLTDGTDKIIVIKSTVVPGTTTRLEKKYPQSHFAFNPEFLTEANYLEDFVNADRTIGGASNNLVSRRLVALYRERFPNQKIFQTDPTSAEMVKYMANAYLSMKVIFANEMFELCQALEIKYEEVKAMAVADHRIEDTHLDVTTTKGFGGKCFPKDIVALIARAKELGVDVDLLKTVWEKNKKIRSVCDWEDIPFAVSEASSKDK
jgi:UDPglucose 6-dehydrogenase